VGRFDERFSHEQKAALVAAQVDEDGPQLTATRAVAAAKAGQLPGVEPFETELAAMASDAEPPQQEQANERARAKAAVQAAIAVTSLGLV
jgi:hypothetical protein